MRRAIKINIPEPCRENYFAMPAKDNGRHCSKCDKTIVDLRGMDDKKLQDFVTSDDFIGCGVFSPTQLNRPIWNEPVNTTPSFPLAFAFTSLIALITPSQVKSQYTPQVRFELPSVPENHLPQTRINKEKFQIPEFVSGTILDTNGNPVNQAYVYLFDSQQSVWSDSAGHFKLDLTEFKDTNEIELRIYANGYSSKLLILNDSFRSLPDPIVLENTDIVIYVAGGIGSVSYFQPIKIRELPLFINDHFRRAYWWMVRPFYRLRNWIKYSKSEEFDDEG